jgi:diadenosine tetraphosphate (Ap4A) HIT family hydrolase
MLTTTVTGMQEISDGVEHLPDATAERPCPFCSGDAVDEHLRTRVLLDGYPVSDGHTLIVPRRHVASLWDLDEEEYLELFTVARRLAAATPEQPDGWNLGVNVGAAAGQTVWHVHLHLIPRRAGDTPDPRGGVRWVIPSTARYWD